MSLTKQEFAELAAKAGAGTLTDEEAAALEPYRAKNAIILAAGVCRRCAPIAYDYPKPLIEVRGERLIERQIRQLLSVGITDITVVVGYLKEKFDYLADKYGVSFVENANYITTDTIVSLAQAADRLGNTYIVYGDQFFTVNPFERYVYRSFYATTLTDTDDAWVMETNPDGVVTDMIMSEDGGERLQGPCYVDAENGAALAAALGETLADLNNVSKSWEYAWYLNRDKLNIVTRYYPAGVVNSFKSMDDLAAFDDSYLIHVDSQALRNICGILECTPEDLYGFEPVTGGQTNFSVSFYLGDNRYVYRFPLGYAVTELDRAAEAIANTAARDCGVDPTFIYEDPETGWKISHFIKGAHPINEQDENDAYPATLLIKKYHEATKDLVVDATYDSWEFALFLEKSIADHNFEMDARTASYRDRIVKLAGYLEADNFHKELSNNDCWYANFLWDDDHNLHFIDWEFAAMSDWMTDLAKHVESYYISVSPDNREFMRENLKLYLGRDYTPEEWRHFIGLVMIRCWWVCVYTINFISASEMASEWDIGIWLGLCWTFFDEQLDYTLSLYENV